MFIVPESTPLVSRIERNADAIHSIGEFKAAARLKNISPPRGDDVMVNSFEFTLSRHQLLNKH